MTTQLNKLLKEYNIEYLTEMIINAIGYDNKDTKKTIKNRLKKHIIDIKNEIVIISSKDLYNECINKLVA